MRKSLFVSGTPSKAAELAPLGDRLSYMFVLRIGIGVIAAFLAIFGTEFIGPVTGELLRATALYGLATGLTELVRRYLKGRGLPLIAGMLLVDGVYLAYATFISGGPQSPLRFLVYMHLIAVTLLASYRTGLKIALWHSLMLFVTFYAKLAGWLHDQAPVSGSAEAASAEFNRMSLFNIMAFWIVAVGTSVFSAMNERELRRNQDDLRSFAEMAAELEETTDAKVIGAKLLAYFASAFGYSRGVVVGGPDGDMSLLAHRGDTVPQAFNPTLDNVVERAWATHTTQAVKKLHARPNPVLSQLLPGAKDVVVIPLFDEGNPIGYVAAENPSTNGAVQRRTLTMLAQFASHAALGLRSAWLMERISTMAKTDPLTGIFNRGVFEETLKKELARAARDGTQVTLVMIDIDHFKQLNDTYGHHAGDGVLKRVAASLEASTRPFDTAARYGGEEFAMILPTCTANESLPLADRLRQTVAGLGTDPLVTASLGVATYPVHAEHPEDLIKAADEALYESKRMGRNRVTRSRRNSTPPPPPRPASTPMEHALRELAQD